MGFVLKTIGYLFVLIGFLAPLAGVYLYLTREAQVKFYIENAAAFGKLSEEERKSEENKLRADSVAVKDVPHLERDLNVKRTIEDATREGGK